MVPSWCLSKWFGNVWDDVKWDDIHAGCFVMISSSRSASGHTQVHAVRLVDSFNYLAAFGIHAAILSPILFIVYIHITVRG